MFRVHSDGVILEVMTNDLTKFLAAWEYDPDHTTRIVQAEDGRKVLQVRLPLGIEQYELDGRPDGTRPFGTDSVVEFVEAQLSQAVSERGDDSTFEIDHEAAVSLQNEGVLFYYRYLLLFQLNDFERVARDTAHNLRLCSLLERYCPREADRNAVLQFKPYILRMNAVSRAMLSIQNQAKEVAEGIVRQAIRHIEELVDIDTPAFRFEKARSVTYLQSALTQIEKQPVDQRERLKLELDEAVENEEYEKAAELRDQLRNITGAG